jgi:hypothetical protein
VTTLQRFLVSRNYPGGGTWMITGYYGAATAAAVRNFQTAQGLGASGVVDSQTRLALDRVSCGGVNPVTPVVPSYTTPSYPSYAPTYPTYPAAPVAYPTYPGYGYGFGCDGFQGYAGAFYGIGTYYGNCPTYNANQAQLGSPTVTYLSPASGAIGESVTIFGTGFSTAGNTVHFGSGVITNLGSPDGRSVSFTVSSKLTGYGSQTVGLGAYYVSVTNASGYTSNTSTFTVTSLGSLGTPVISNVSGPSTLAAGAVGTWSITTSNPYGAYLTVAVEWGDTQNLYAQNAAQQIAGSGSQTATFTHVYAQQGTYTIQFKVTNQNGQSTISTQSVVVTGTSGTGSISISSVTPTSGRTGTQIAIQGSGFTQYDNTVRFGSGGTMHLPAYNGTIYYTVPQYLSPCDISTSGTCPLYLQLVTPGTSYPISVSNSNGTSNTISFSVTQ